MSNSQSPDSTLSAEERSHIYWFLGDCFSQSPTQKLLNVWQSLQENNETFDLAELQQQYIYLIAGIKEGYGLIPPYESLYRPNAFPTEIRAAVLSYFEVAGISAESVCEQAPDFLSSELRLLSLLSYHQHQAKLINDAKQVSFFNELQHEFLKHHLSVWLPEYCQKLMTEDKSGFYKQLAVYTQAFVFEFE